MTGGHVVCVGLICPSLVARVGEHPAENSHAYYRDRMWFLGTDAAIVAATLARWGIEVYLIGNALGDDCFGRMYISSLLEYGIKGEFHLEKAWVTPLEFIFVDSLDVRKWYSEDAPSVWNSLLNVDLSRIEGAAMVYTDWYALEGAKRAIAYAVKRRIPVFLNLGRSGEPALGVAESLARASFLQAHLNEEIDSERGIVLPALLARRSSYKSVVVTLGSKGCVGRSNGEIIRVKAPFVDVVDTNGAGATFSAACIYSKLNGWSLKEELRFATVAASSKCGSKGIIELDVDVLKSRVEDAPLEEVHTGEVSEREKL